MAGKSLIVVAVEVPDEHREFAETVLPAIPEVLRKEGRAVDWKSWAFELKSETWGFVNAALAGASMTETEMTETEAQALTERYGVSAR